MKQLQFFFLFSVRVDGLVCLVSELNIYQVLKETFERNASWKCFLHREI